VGRLSATSDGEPTRRRSGRDEQVDDARTVRLEWAFERRGETGRTVVVPVPVPDADLTGAAVTEYCLDDLAASKHPREVAIVDEPPRTTTRKVQRYELEGESGGEFARLGPSSSGRERERPTPSGAIYRFCTAESEYARRR
jgi:acyl-CoA synthetase (AMP-forming)/AMP-acid ligase II